MGCAVGSGEFDWDEEPHSRCDDPEIVCGPASGRFGDGAVTDALCFDRYVNARLPSKPNTIKKHQLAGCFEVHIPDLLVEGAGVRGSQR